VLKSKTAHLIKSKKENNLKIENLRYEHMKKYRNQQQLAGITFLTC
jgi:hypothetical protein